MRSAAGTATPVETSPPRPDRDTQSSNPGPAGAGEEEEALLWDGCLDDIDMTELADLVRVFFA